MRRVILLWVSRWLGQPLGLRLLSSVYDYVALIVAERCAGPLLAEGVVVNLLLKLLPLSFELIFLLSFLLLFLLPYLVLDQLKVLLLFLLLRVWHWDTLRDWLLWLRVRLLLRNLVGWLSWGLEALLRWNLIVLWRCLIWCRLLLEATGSANRLEVAVALIADNRWLIGLTVT